MFIRNDVTGTRPVGQANAVTTLPSIGNASEETLDRLTQVSIGKQFQAEILSRLEDGTFLVKIDIATARMALPEGSSVGDKISLTAISATPRPTFLLGDISESVAPSLSPAARLIGNVIQTAQEMNLPNTLVGKAPIVDSPDVPVPQLANAMQETVELSGLFYESHVAEWATGNRTQTALMQEPQAKMAEFAPKIASSSSNQAILENEALAVPASKTGHFPEPPIATSNEEANASPIHGESSHAQPLQVSAETAHLINQQLNTLENNRVMWQGELWPGQQVEWEISEEKSGSQSGSSQEAIEKTWQSVLRMTFPNLGSVTATVLLSGNDVQVRLQAPSETAAALRAHGRELETALSETGTRLGFLAVNQNESA